MSELGFKYFKIPDPMDNVCELANELLYTCDVRNILKDVYPDMVLEGDIPMQEVLSLMR